MLNSVQICKFKFARIIDAKSKFQVERKCCNIHFLFWSFKYICMEFLSASNAYIYNMLMHYSSISIFTIEFLTFISKCTTCCRFYLYNLSSYYLSLQVIVLWLKTLDLRKPQELSYRFKHVMYHVIIRKNCVWKKKLW